MLRRLVAVAFLFVSVWTTSHATLAADPPQGLTGVFLTTRYPAQTVKAGETTTLDLSIHNYKLPPQQLALTVPEIAQGWKATMLGGGQPVGAVQVAPDSEERLQLRLEPPSGAGHGDYHFTVEAKGGNQDLKLPITVTVGEEVPAKLKMTTNFPDLRGTATTAFKYRVTVTNDSGRDATINFSADAPKNFQVTFTEAYGSQQLTSIPIEAGKSKDIEASLTLPRETPADDYKLTLHAKTEQASADLNLTLTILGQPRLAARHRAFGDDSRRLEVELRSKDGAAGRGRRNAERQDDLDPVRARDCRRLPGDDPRQRDWRSVGVGEFPDYRADLDLVGRDRHRDHCDRALGRGLCRRPLRPSLGRTNA
jgi:hypothetical protein